MKLKHLVFLSSLLLLLVACEDPSGVGLSLVGETGGEPQSSVFPVAGMPERRLQDVTGGTASGGLTRVLAGRVDDPLLGQIESTAYLDFQTVSGISDAFRNGTVASAELRLTRDYVYGDTTSTVRLDVHDMSDEWDAVGLTSDTVLSVGGAVISVDFVASESAVVVALPEDWIAAHDATLRSTGFSQDFHGFALRPGDGNAVAGFVMASAVLRVVVASDTVNYIIHRGFSSVAHQVADGLADRSVVQDGAGPSVALEFNPSTWDTLGAAAVNQAVVRLRADTIAVGLELPANFVRPQLRMLQLAGYRFGELAFTLNAEMNSNGEFVFRRPQDIPFFFREMMENEDRELRINVPAGIHTIDPVFLHGPTSSDGQPTVVLTLTRTDL